MMRVILMKDLKSDGWTAWILDAPEMYARGATSDEAFRELRRCFSHRFDGARDCRINRRRSSEGRVEIEVSFSGLLAMICPDCKGQGQYVGLREVEECRTCQGAGELIA